MQRKPGYPVANCNIKMPDSIPISEAVPCDDDGDLQQRRQQLINFGHTQWGFNNWSWSVNKQELDFVDYANGKYCAGVVAFVSITVKTIDIHRENIGYATCVAGQKGSAIYQARKCAVTNALRETLLGFGGSVATELMELLESHRPEPAPQPEQQPENNQNLANKPTEPKNAPLAKNIRKDSVEMAPINPVNIRHPLAPPVMKNAVVQNPPPVAKALPMPANLPPAANRPPVVSAPRPPAAPHVRPNSNEGEERDEEARAERKRRQRLAQEEFRLKQLQKQRNEEQHQSSSMDSLLMAIPTQDIVIEDSGASKRKTPPPDAPAKRRLGVSKLDIVESEQV